MKRPLLFTAKLLLVTSATCVVWAVASGLGTALLDVHFPESGATAGEALTGVFIATFANVATTVYAVRRSRWTGWKLGLGVAWIYFGIHTFNAQIETLYFNSALAIPLRGVLSFIVTGAAVTAVVAPLVVWLFGPRGDEPAPARWMQRPTPLELALKIALIALVVYPALYFLFGYYVLWQVPEARELYSGSRDLAPFVAHMRGVLADDPWIYPWQVARGLVWVALAVPVLRMSRAGWPETAVIVGLLFAVLMNAIHIVPNPYMSSVVRRAHFLETATSNFILGLVITWLLHRSHRSLGDLFGRGDPRAVEADEAAPRSDQSRGSSAS